MNPDVVKTTDTNPTAEVPKQETKSPEQLAAEAREYVANQFTVIADRERNRLAVARGLLDKDSNITQRGNLLVSPENVKGSKVTLAGLRELVKLPGDTMRYAKDKNGALRIATDRNGFISFPKQRGRRKPHMSRHSHTIKNKSIAIFKQLFTLYATEAQIRTKNDGVEYNGVPTEELSKLGAKAAKLGAIQARNERKAANRRARRRKELSRRINYGIQPRATNVQAYIGA